MHTLSHFWPIGQNKPFVILYTMLPSPEIGSQTRFSAPVINMLHEVNARPGDIVALDIFLDPLRKKDAASYEHCVRVGSLSRSIARHQHMDERALLFAGLLHDLGKINTPIDTLVKTEGWTPSDDAIMQNHVMDGYNLIKGRFDFTAEIILFHHQFQENKYPKELPQPLHSYSKETQQLIYESAMVLAMADMYDALHRVNEKFGVKRSLSGEEIRTRLTSRFSDRKKTIDELYASGIFTEQ